MWWFSLVGARVGDGLGTVAISITAGGMVAEYFKTRVFTHFINPCALCTNEPAHTAKQGNPQAHVVHTHALKYAIVHAFMGW